MEHKHNDDILKTMGETIKGENGNTPATPQPKKQWNDYYIKSNYRDSEKEQFLLEIISEDEENYYVRLLPEFQNDFQEKDSITPLRKIMVGDENNTYSLVKKPKQMSIFEF